MNSGFNSIYFNFVYHKIFHKDGGKLVNLKKKKTIKSDQ